MGYKYNNNRTLHESPESRNHLNVAKWQSGDVALSSLRWHLRWVLRHRAIRLCYLCKPLFHDLMGLLIIRKLSVVLGICGLKCLILHLNK